MDKNGKTVRCACSTNIPRICYETDASARTSAIATVIAAKKDTARLHTSIE